MKRYILLLITNIVFMGAIAQKSAIKTQKSGTGLSYKFFKANKGPRVTVGDEVFFKLKGRLSDSLIYDSYRNLRAPYMNFIIQENYAKRSFEDGLCMLTTGDSALFLINADTFFTQYMGSPTPSFAKKGDPLYFFVKVDSVVSKQVSAERKAAKEKALEVQKANELVYIDDYVKASGLNYTKTASGMYYLITKPTNGPKAKAGDKISALYTGKLLDGKIFDSNQASGQAFDFTLNGHMVIAGWDEIFSILHEGETATIVLPSSLGYGPVGAGDNIPPYSPLVFDVVFLKVTSGQ